MDRTFQVAPQIPVGQQPSSLRPTAREQFGVSDVQSGPQSKVSANEAIFRSLPQRDLRSR
jgi:hypothetical protein